MIETCVTVANPKIGNQSKTCLKCTHFVRNNDFYIIIIAEKFDFCDASEKKERNFSIKPQQQKKKHEMNVINKILERQTKKKTKPIEQSK